MTDHGDDVVRTSHSQQPVDAATRLVPRQFLTDSWCKFVFESL